jgi:hypothetical protein
MTPDIYLLLFIPEAEDAFPKKGLCGARPPMYTKIKCRTHGTKWLRADPVPCCLAGGMEIMAGLDTDGLVLARAGDVMYHGIPWLRLGDHAGHIGELIHNILNGATPILYLRELEHFLERHAVAGELLMLNRELNPITLNTAQTQDSLDD